MAFILIGILSLTEYNNFKVHSPMSIKRTALVVDFKSTFLDLLKKANPNLDILFFKAEDGQVAQTMIMDLSTSLAAIYVSPYIRREPTWQTILKTAFLNRPATALYLIYEDRKGAKRLDPENLVKLGIKEASADKKNIHQELKGIITNIVSTFDGHNALEKAEHFQESLGEEISGLQGDFVPISAADFISGLKSFFDVYAKTPMGRYIKLLRAGDSFELERIQSYLQKGVKFFYIRKELQGEYVKYSSHVSVGVVQSKAVSVETKTKQALNAGEETLRYLLQKGIQLEDLKHASGFINNVRQLVAEIKTTNKRSDALSDFVADLGAYQHGVATAMIAGILAHHMQISTEKPFEVVGMAAMFHDIGLKNMPEHLREEDESKMTPQELALYQTHPAESAKILRTLGDVDPAALQAIEQHHMRLAGQGFPSRTGTTLVTRVAEIIGVSDEFAKIIARAYQDPGLNIISEVEAKIFPYFGASVVKFFKQAFMPDYNESVKMGELNLPADLVKKK